MKKLIIAIVAVSGAAIVSAQAETIERKAPGGGFRAEMKALIAGDGLRAEDLTRLMQERSQARFAALDADEDGVVDLAEVLAAADKRAQARFERMGPDENGIVTRAGRDGGARHRRGDARSEEGRSQRAAEHFARLDADRDGAISREEFEAGFKAREERFAGHRKGPGKGHAEHGKQRTEHRSEMPTEMREMHGRLRALLRDGVDLEGFSGFMREHATTRFAALDADGDGKLTAEEFNARIAGRAERLFARMDTNDDGVVTRDDRPHDRPRGGSRR